jgi:AraC-like DNA-binding protein
MTERFNFSSLDRPAASAFDDYVELYKNGSDVTPGRGPFHAHVRAWRLDGVLLFERRLSGAVHSRIERTATDAFSHIVLTLVLAGRLEGSPESGFVEALPGEIVLADTTRPTRTEPVDAHLITASVDRSIIEAGLGAAGGLHGLVLKPPSNLILADFMQSLARRADGLTAGARAPLSRALVDILASVDGFVSRASSETRRQEFIRREVVERHIASHLGQRGLSVETISEATGISRSALYRLFDSLGGVAKLIQRRRLDALRSAIDAQAMNGGAMNGEAMNGEAVTGEAEAAPETLADLTARFGFSNEDQARRQFAEAFGITPRAYLQSLAALGPASGEASYRRWIGWMSEVS